MDTKTAPVQGEPEAATINAALGGTQAVQDFAIFVGMWELSPEWPRSFYGQVQEAATAGSTYLGELTGGLGLDETTGLQGAVVDSTGQIIPSLRVDYALLTIPPSDLQLEAEALTQGVSLESGDLTDLLADPNLESSGLVVEVITADYSRARTHAGPGDAALMDLTFVDSIQPGADVAMSYIFGQTLPGDPEIEEDLQPLDLLRYRWNQGLIAVLGDPERIGSGVASDHSVEIIDQSTLSATGEVLVAGTARQPLSLNLAVSRAKETIAAPAVLVGTDEESGAGGGPGDGTTLSRRQVKQLILQDFQARAEEYLYDIADQPEGETLFRLSNGQLLVINSDHNEAILVSDLSDFDPDCQGEGCPSLQDDDIVATGTYEDVISGIVASAALHHCQRRAAFLNAQNGAATSLAEIIPDEPEASATTEPTQPEASTTTEPSEPEDPLAPQPGPVGCTPGLPSGPPKVPSGATWGDIHLGTMDGKRYSNQAAGEFLLFENDATTIQVRTEPAAGGVVSVATAFAFTMGGDVVSLHAGGTTRINGEVAQLERGIPSQVGDGELLWWSGGWVAVWPDGTILRVNQSGSLMFSSVTPSNGATTGMLGNSDGDPDNDFFTRDGELLNTDADEDFEGFYSTYVDSWRITPAESLFYYGPGESTDTFTIEGVPVERVTAEDLPAGVFAEAEEVCTQAGVASDDVLEMCILDVGVTGDPAFAYESYLAQAAIGDPQEDVAAEPPSVSGEGDNVLTVGDLMIAFGSDPPIQDPSGPRPTWTCESADGVYTAISRFQETPTIRYELDLQYISPDNPRGLDEQFRLIVLRNAEQYAWVWTNAEQFADSVDFVEIDGDALTASGEMFLNDPLQPGLGPISQLPAGTELDDFELSVSCRG